MGMLIKRGDCNFVVEDEAYRGSINRRIVNQNLKKKAVKGYTRNYSLGYSAIRL